jgi:hypothetical protein
MNTLKSALIVLLGILLGIALASLCGCVDSKVVEACGKACGTDGVKQVDVDRCTCNPKVNCK